MKIWIAAVLSVLAGLTAAQAETTAPIGVTVVHAWSRATPPGATTGVVYLTVVNAGASDDQLLGGSSPVAETLQFHSSMDDNGVMKMRELTSIDVAAGASVPFKPSSTHLMLLHLKQPLKAGQTFPLNLTFKEAGTINVNVLIGTVGAMDDPAAAASK
jgi:copper(I)-binding protein